MTGPDFGGQAHVQTSGSLSRLRFHHALVYGGQAVQALIDDGREPRWEILVVVDPSDCSRTNRHGSRLIDAVGRVTGQVQQFDPERRGEVWKQGAFLVPREVQHQPERQSGGGGGEGGGGSPAAAAAATAIQTESAVAG